MRDRSSRLRSRSVKKMNLLQRVLNDVDLKHRAYDDEAENEINGNALQLAVKRNSVQVAALYEDFNRCSVRTTARRAKEISYRTSVNSETPPRHIA